MKIIKTASGRSLKLSHDEWKAIGKQAGWTKVSEEPEVVDEVVSEPAPTPMTWDPSAVREEAQQEEEQSSENAWADATVSFETKETRYGKLTFVIIGNTSRAMAKDLKAAGYKAFKNRVTGEWTWSKIVNKSKSEEIDPQKLEAVKMELSSKGVNVSALSTGPVETAAPSANDQAIEEAAKEVNLDDVPEEMIYWHNEMEAAQQLSAGERKKKYSDIIFGALEDIGEEVEKDATSEKSQEIIKSLLKASSNFHNYSFWNSMMIAIMRPNAEYVASADNWKRMGRVPKAGHAKIPIMFPYKGKKLSDEDKADMTDQQIAYHSRTKFGLGSAIAFEDTEPITGWVAKRGKFKGQGPFEPPVWQIDSNEATEWLSQLYEAAYNWATTEKKFKIETEAMDTMGGYASLSGKIAINDKSDGIVKISTLFHEIAHQLIHFDPDFSRRDSSKEDRETDAEASAYVVCSHYHIESKDTPLYLAAFGADKSKILARFNYIQKAAIEMFEGIDRYMATMMTGKSEQEKEMEPDEMPTHDRVPEQSLSMAGNLFGTLGLFKQAEVMPIPFLYELEDEDNENSL
jgi:hypothetical protein